MEPIDSLRKPNLTRSGVAEREIHLRVETILLKLETQIRQLFIRYVWNLQGVSRELLALAA